MTRELAVGLALAAAIVALVFWSLWLPPLWVLVGSIGVG